MLSRRVVILSDISCIYLGRPLFAIGSIVRLVGLCCLLPCLRTFKDLGLSNACLAAPFIILPELNENGGLDGVQKIETLSEQLIIRRPVAVVSCAVLDVRHVLA